MEHLQPEAYADLPEHETSAFPLLAPELPGSQPCCLGTGNSCPGMGNSHLESEQKGGDVKMLC